MVCRANVNQINKQLRSSFNKFLDGSYEDIPEKSDEETPAKHHEAMFLKRQSRAKEDRSLLMLSKTPRPSVKSD